MFRTTLWILVCLAALAGCASQPAAPGASQLPWRDSAFDYRPEMVTVSRDELFRLDPQLQAKLRQLDHESMPSWMKLRQLLALVFGPDGKSFAYTTGHSTVAAETWRLQRGDCLSLTVLTYAVAQALHMRAEMQDVSIPVVYDRRGQFDVINQHVNVLFRGASRQQLEEAKPLDVTVDFEPQLASRQRGRALSENGILARYYNNIATEHLAQGRTALAYAHFKASINADPAFAAPYGNLAVLYREVRMPLEAEQLLQHALVLTDTPDVPLHALHQLLVEQGRGAEALRYERALQAVRSRDPYHWIQLGRQHLDEGEIRQAIGALEQARNISSGFDEVHRYLAVAYWRAGDVRKAREELAVLASRGDETGAAKLQRKLKGNQY